MQYCQFCDSSFKPFHKADSFCSQKCRKRFYGAEWQKKYHGDPKVKEQARKKARERYRLNPEKWAIAARKYRSKNHHKYRVWNVKAKYGLTMAQLVALGPSCHICGEVFNNRSSNARKRQHVDHDHATNEVRGLLCMGCNQGLGNFRDDPSRLLKAIQYLAQHSAKDIEFTA